MTTKYKWSEMSGRERDALVAEKVMKLYKLNDKWIESPKDPLSPIQGIAVPLEQYSTDISAAWEVVEELKEYRFVLEDNDWNGQEYRCRFGLCESRLVATAPEAICLAALKAVGVEIET